jgi:hypothetical protein
MIRVARSRASVGSPTLKEHPIQPSYFEPGDAAYRRWFLWMFRQIYGWAKRAAQGDKRSFDKLFDAAASLQLVRGSLHQMRRRTIGSMDYFGVANPEMAAEIGPDIWIAQSARGSCRDAAATCN